MTKEELLIVLEAYDGVYFIPDDIDTTPIERDVKRFIEDGATDVLLFSVYGNCGGIRYLFRFTTWRYFPDFTKEEEAIANRIKEYYGDRCFADGYYVVIAPPTEVIDVKG